MRRSHVYGVVAALFVALFGGIALGGHPNLLPSFIRDPLVGDKDTRVVREALDKIHDVYYRKVPDSDLANAAISGMVASLHDRFSNYLSPRDYKRFNDATHSRYEGVGMEVDKTKRGLRVLAVYDGSPARRAGIAPGDVVLAANGVALRGHTADRGSSLIKGPPGTQVTLRILHHGKVETLHVTRARVTVPVVASRLRTLHGKKLGVVRLATFSSGAHGEFDAALKRLLRKGAKGFVVDLRENGGGLVDEAQLIASAFLDGGTVVTTGGRSVGRDTLKAIGKPIVPAGMPVVVLVDQNTASASEIVTGALQDRHRAEVVGTETFGKGVFQQILELSNGGALDITAGQYFTPSGRNLGGKGVHTGAGIRPDVTAKDNPDTKPDEGLDKAMAVLGAKVK